jgi:uncharacterized protein (DUF427 family)
MPDTHPIRIQAHTGRVRVLFEGHELADSGDVIVLHETGHDPVFYFPQGDVQMSALRRNDHVTHCPHKGDATHFTINRDGKLVENVAWSYESPKAGCDLIAGRIAFYPRHVDFQVEGDVAAEPVRHVPAHDPPYADSADGMSV